MFLVLLKFSDVPDRGARARAHLQGHKAWIKRGLDDGVFLLVGSLQPDLGGALLVRGPSREALRARVERDPFVREDVLRAEILEFSPALASPELRALLE